MKRKTFRHVKSDLRATILQILVNPSAQVRLRSTLEKSTGNKHATQRHPQTAQQARPLGLAWRRALWPRTLCLFLAPADRHRAPSVFASSFIYHQRPAARRSGLGKFDGKLRYAADRSEERRVGKEC